MPGLKKQQQKTNWSVLPGSGGTAFSPGTWEARQVDLLSSRPIWSIQQVPEQPWLQKKNPSLGMGTCHQSAGGGGGIKEDAECKANTQMHFCPISSSSLT